MSVCGSPFFPFAYIKHLPKSEDSYWTPKKIIISRVIYSLFDACGLRHNSGQVNGKEKCILHTHLGRILVQVAVGAQVFDVTVHEPAERGGEHGKPDDHFTYNDKITIIRFIIPLKHQIHFFFSKAFIRYQKKYQANK